VVWGGGGVFLVWGGGGVFFFWLVGGVFGVVGWLGGGVFWGVFGGFFFWWGWGVCGVYLAKGWGDTPVATPFPQKKNTGENRTVPHQPL